MEGMVFFIDLLTLDEAALEKERGLCFNYFSQWLYKFNCDFRIIEQNKMAQVTGSIISAVREACRNGLLDWSPRLMLAMYTCDIQCSSS
jgi:ribosome assembly protein 1